MRTPHVFIEATGVFLPETVSVEDAVEQGLYPAADARSHGLTGAAVAGDLPAPEMALRAARQALDRCARPPGDVGLLLYVDSWHQGPDGWQPQYYLQRHLLGDGALAVELRHGCNGVFSALELAADRLRADTRDRPVLVTAADNFGTPMMDRWSMGPGYIAGDAASALVLSRRPGFARLLSVGSVTVSEAEEVHRCGEPLFPPGPTTGRPLDFAARAAEFNRRSVRDGAGTMVWVTVHQRLLQVVKQTLGEAGIDLGDVTRVAFMNYARDIVEQRCMAALELPLSRSTWDFGRTVGHLSASDQVVSLDHLLATGRLEAGDHVLLLGVGPGVTISSAVVQILNPPPWGSRA